MCVSATVPRGPHGIIEQLFWRCCQMELVMSIVSHKILPWHVLLICLKVSRGDLVLAVPMVPSDDRYVLSRIERILSKRRFNSGNQCYVYCCFSLGRKAYFTLRNVKSGLPSFFKVNVSGDTKFVFRIMEVAMSITHNIAMAPCRYRRCFCRISGKINRIVLSVKYQDERVSP